MTIFDIYAFADYSGAASIQSQKKEIAVSIISKNDTFQWISEKRHTRESLRSDFKRLLIKAASENHRVIFGFDHSYSFPIGFYEAVTGTKWDLWEQLLNLLCNGTSELPPVDDRPREWAKAINKKLNIGNGGPFWGPRFSYQEKDPRFRFGHIKQKRLTEERIPRTKPIYKIGGIGSVGLQSLYGIQHIAKLKHELKANCVELFCWPFDGWDLPSSGHVLVEIYPGLFNKTSKGHTEDARACSARIYEEDKTNTLARWFNPDLGYNEQKRARLEGWIFGEPCADNKSQGYA